MTTFSFAQDTVKVLVNFTNTEFYDIFNVNNENTQGLSASLDAKIYSKDKFRLSGVFQWKRANLINGKVPSIGLESLNFSDDPNDTYSFGPRLSYKLANNLIEPYAHALIGFNTTYRNDRKLSRIYGAGVFINLGHIVLNPFEYDSQFIGDFTKGKTSSYSAGVGVRF